jgi:hypothetical protein
VLSYIGKIGGHDTIWEFKWLHEVKTQNRLTHNILWPKDIVKF